MKVAAYLRVSTDRQAEQGQGLGVQRQAVKSWAKANGHTVRTWHADEGASGSNGLEARVALADALQEAEGRPRPGNGRMSAGSTGS
ncbi:MAG: recombinase family protein [Actinomycetota bacterium]